MQVVDFTIPQIEQAQNIALENYNTERGYVPALPPIDAVPHLKPFAENGLGVAAFDGGKMVGFLCSVPPFQNAFGSTNAAGIFSPMGANGAIGENRAKIYARMYQMAGEKWAKAGASSHAVCLYAHDKETQEQFFQYGFGLRCIDGIRGMDEKDASDCDGFTISELKPEDYPLLLSMNKMLVVHLAQSPAFLCYPPVNDDEMVQRITRPGARYFSAAKAGEPIAYIKISDGGENFACDSPDMQNICGAFCLPEYRGNGVVQSLLNAVMRTLKAEGYARLGVDFESFNPTAYGFWLKYFNAYTHSVVRRIDENVISTM